MGDIIASDGKNTKNISARSNRGTGVVNQIMSMLEDICFGKYYFQVAMVFRNSLLISSLLTNAESWYNLTAAEIDELEKVDENLLRRVLEAPAATPKEMLYLELGVSPIRNIIKSRRINFLQYILKENEESLIHTFLMAQLCDPTRNDWGVTVMKDIEDFNINLSFDKIESMSEHSFKNLVQKKEKIHTLNYLNGVKGSHSKVKHIDHSVLEMADYLKPNQITNSEAKFIFTLRSRMLDVRSNYPGQHTDTLCPLCTDVSDTQEHLLLCSELDTDSTVVVNLPIYEHLFGEDLEAKVSISRMLKEKFTQRQRKK